MRNPRPSLEFECFSSPPPLRFPVSSSCSLAERWAIPQQGEEEHANDKDAFQPDGGCSFFFLSFFLEGAQPACMDRHRGEESLSSLASFSPPKRRCLFTQVCIDPSLLNGQRRNPEL